MSLTGVSEMGEGDEAEDEDYHSPSKLHMMLGKLALKCIRTLIVLIKPHMMLKY